MPFALAAVAAVLFVIAYLLWRGALNQQAQASKLTLTETSTCGEIAALAQGVGAEVGGGSFRQRCEVIGLSAADGAPVRAPETRADVVWHRTRVTHRWYEMEQTTDDRGNHRTRRVEKSDVVSDFASEAPFAVSDGSGRLIVRPVGADVDHPEKSVDRLDGIGPGTSQSFASLLLGGGQSGTIGFQVEEWVIRPGVRIYVHGEVGDEDGRLVFGTGDGRLIVSTRSEADLVKDHRSGAMWRKLGAWLCIAGGVASIAGAVGSLLA
jgi:E3 Ubiquitin ligase